MTFEDLNQKDYPKFLALYESAFPNGERRPYDDAQHLESFINMKGGKFFVTTVKDGDEFIGFLSYWKFKGYIYIEHFAVMPEKRGRNIGRTLLNHVMKEAGDNVLLEVELPDTDEAKRRIKFYEQLGFRIRREINYMQPSYGPGLPQMPMLLMTHGDVDLSHGLDDIKAMLREVYNVEVGAN